MRYTSVVWISILLCVLATNSVIAEISEPDLVKQLETGTINWSKGLIKAKGEAVPPEIYQGNQQGRSMAVREAMGIAAENLFKAVSAIRIDAGTRVCDVVAKREEIREKVKGMVKEAEVISQKFLTDGTVEVTMQMPLNGGFAQLILPPGIKQIESIKPIPPEKAPESAPLPVAPAEDPPQETYTGVVVDARGLCLRPAMAPRIMDENGEEVFGAEFASREFAVQQGMSGYTTDLAAASKDTRVTDHPLIIKGLKPRGIGRCDIMVSNTDANRLRSNSKHLSVLKKCRVMIVMDRSNPVENQATQVSRVK